MWSTSKNVIAIIVGGCFWIMVILGIVWVSGSERAQVQRDQQKVAQQAQALSDKINSFKSSSGTLADLSGDYTFSYQVQDVLNVPKQPVYLEAKLFDIYEDGGQYHAVFDYSGATSPDLILDLVTDAGYLKLLGDHPMGNYGLAATISSVHKNSLAIAGVDNGVGNVDLSGFPSNTLMASGSLQNVISLDNQ